MGICGPGRAEMGLSHGGLMAAWKAALGSFTTCREVNPRSYDCLIDNFVVEWRRRTSLFQVQVWCCPKAVRQLYGPATRARCFS